MKQSRFPQLPASLHRTMCKIDRLLDRAYGAPAEELDNKPDPLDEAIYIILTFQTDIERARSVWKELRSAFPDWEGLLDAPVGRVARVLRAGGLHKQKARTIKRLIQFVKDHVGRLSLDFLRNLDDDSAERFLLRLPGLSWKGARCVLLYSLGRRAFPVDGNTLRILRRTGVVPQNVVYRRRGLHDALQHAVTPARRMAFHINVVVHGQRTCLPLKPRCHECPARIACLKRNVPQSLG